MNPQDHSSDLCLRFLIEDSTVRGEIVQLDTSLQDVFARHDYPAEIRTLLGELLAAAVLLASTVKIEGSLIIQARGGLPLNLLMVECDHERNIRALARWEGDTSGKGFRDLLQGSQLVITLDPRTGERYQGAVPLQGRSIAESLEFYFRQSEQLPTRLWLTQSGGRAAGLILQQLPFNSAVDVSKEQAEEDWQRLTTLADTLTADEQLQLQPQEILHRLYHEEQIRVFPPADIRFHCSCSAERFGSALASLGREELEDIVREQGSISTTCEFCNHTYSFDRVDVEVLLSPGASKAPQLQQ